MKKISKLAHVVATEARKVNKTAVREYTNKILEMIDQGLLSAQTVAEACLSYMSEDEVEDMARSNDFLYEEDEEEERTDEDEYEAIDFEMIDDDIKKLVQSLKDKYLQQSVDDALEDTMQIRDEYKELGGDFEYDESIKQYTVTDRDTLIKAIQQIAEGTYKATV